MNKKLVEKMYNSQNSVLSIESYDSATVGNNSNEIIVKNLTLKPGNNSIVNKIVCENAVIYIKDNKK